MWLTYDYRDFRNLCLRWRFLKTVIYCLFVEGKSGDNVIQFDPPSTRKRSKTTKAIMSQHWTNHYKVAFFIALVVCVWTVKTDENVYVRWKTKKLEKLENVSKLKKTGKSPPSPPQKKMTRSANITRLMCSNVWGWGGQMTAGLLPALSFACCTASAEQKHVRRVRKP